MVTRSITLCHQIVLQVRFFFPLVIFHLYSSETKWQIRLDGSFVLLSLRCPETFRISMPTWTLVHHKRNILVIQSHRWWLLLTIKSPVSVIRCPQLHVSVQPWGFVQKQTVGESFIHLFTCCLNTLFLKSLLLRLHQKCKEASNFFSPS